MHIEPMDVREINEQLATKELECYAFHAFKCCIRIRHMFLNSTLVSRDVACAFLDVVAERLQAAMGWNFEKTTLAALRQSEIVEHTSPDSVLRTGTTQAPDHSWVEQLTDGDSMLVVPLASQLCDRKLGEKLPVPCLVGLPQRDPMSPWVCALADAIVEAEGFKYANQVTQHKLDHSLYQITACFEELTWLRSLAEHFEICSLNDGLARAGQATLPALRELIFAQELFLFGIEPGSSPPESSPMLLAHDGAGQIDSPSARSLLLRLTCQPNEPLIVWNSPVSANPSEYTEAIRNCIVVPVMKADELHGWLLAINKCMPIDEELWSESAIQDQNLIEFGTCETGLMNTMAVMLATHSKNVNLLCEKEELLLGVLRALVTTIDAKDAYTGGHSDRVAKFSKEISQRLGLSSQACEEIYMSGLLHDIGKIGVPDAVLGKPERLTEDEFQQIKRHPQIGYEILKSLKPFAYLLPGVLHHHEAFDGSGYPQRLAGEDISLMGRIIAVADSFDAMTSNRTYRQGMPIEKAVQILTSGRGKQWDPAIVDAFLSIPRIPYASS